MCVCVCVCVCLCVSIYTYIYTYIITLNYITNAPTCFGATEPYSEGFDIAFAKEIIY